MAHAHNTSTLGGGSRRIKSFSPGQVSSLAIFYPEIKRGLSSGWKLSVQARSHSAPPKIEIKVPTKEISKNNYNVLAIFYNKVSWPMWLNHQKCTVSRFWSLEVWERVSGGLSPRRVCLLPLHIISPLSAWPKTPSHKSTIRTHLHGLILIWLIPYLLCPQIEPHFEILGLHLLLVKVAKFNHTLLNGILSGQDIKGGLSARMKHKISSYSTNQKT